MIKNQKIRKGITPVIAVVLLLLITVGAVASAWGLYQQVVDDQSQIDQLEGRQQAEQTQINVRSVHDSNTESDNSYINVTLRNGGQTSINLSEDVDLLVDPDGTSEYLPENLLDNADISQSNCFGGDGEVLTTDGENQELLCNTTVSFPDAGQTVGFRLTYKDVEGYNWDFSCQPTSTTSTIC